MPVSNFPNGFANGVSILGVPVLNIYGGNVYWVNSNGGSNQNKGTRDRPFATLDYAIGRCTANNGDIIMVMPNHAETITGAGGIACDVAGITIVGMGTFNQRPRFLMDGGTAVTITVSVADVTLQNLVFAAGHNGVVACFDITATGCWLDSIEFEDNTTDEHFLTPIKATSTSDGNANGLRVTNCRWVTVDSGALEFLEVNADLDRLVFNGNVYICEAATAGKMILCATGKDLTGCEITWNYNVNGMTANDLFIDNDTTANTGVVAHNRCGHHDVTGAHAMIDLDGVRLFDNLSNSTDTTSGFVLPAIDVDL